MSITDVDNMTDEELLEAFVQTVRKGDFERPEMDSDCVLYQMLKLELRTRMALRNPARD